MTDSPADFPPPRTWPAILWVIAGVVALIAAQVIGGLAAVAWIKFMRPGMPMTLHGLTSNGTVVGIISCVSSLILVTTFLGFTRIRTRAVRLYLGLRLPRVRDFFFSILAILALLVVLGIASERFSDPRAVGFMRDMFLSARREHTLWLLIATVSVAAPIGEEITFRGFFYKTVELRFGAIAAIIITSIGWAALHIQYGLVSIASIGAIGLLLGSVRYHSRSLLLTMLLHGIWNSVALLGSAAQFGG